MSVPDGETRRESEEGANTNHCIGMSVSASDGSEVKRISFADSYDAHVMIFVHFA